MPNPIRTLRKQLGYTQAELAAAIGISRKTLNEYEQREDDPPPPKQTVLAVLALCLWATLSPEGT